MATSSVRTRKRASRPGAGAPESAAPPASRAKRSAPRSKPARTGAARVARRADAVGEPAPAAPPARRPKGGGPRGGKRATPRTRAGKGADGLISNGRALVVVESPTKSRTLTKFLGRGFTVLASNGHIMDLPKSGLGIDLEHDFQPEYVPIESKKKALAKIHEAARDVERIYLAPDPDREGEAIAWHLAEHLKPLRRPLLRLTFNEITQRAVQQALTQPREVDMNLVNAQQARRVLDRLVGYKVSPFLWKKLHYGLSAGRVQSVALRLICEREDEIEAFVPVEYWTLEADVETPTGERFTARLVRIGEQDLEQAQIRGDAAEATARAIAEELGGAEIRVAAVQTAPRQVHPKPPFITSTLQQAAFNRHGFTSQRTMKIAQQLYEGVSLRSQGSVGLITYMRTDSPRLAGEAIGEMRRWLESALGAEYVPESPRNFKGKKGAQDAHEAIRPTAVERTPESLRPFLSEEQYRLYELIWLRAVASQAASAEYLQTTVDLAAGRLGLRASGRVLKFAGFQRLYGFDEDDEKGESRLPELTEGLALAIAGQPLAEEGGPVRPEQHFTQPPPRYTEASLVKALEEEDIGRPSTYATIVTTILGRRYADRDKGRLIPTDLGRTVTRVLVENFPDVFDVGFTASLEDELDGIEDGAQEWHKVVRDLWGPLARDLEKASKRGGKIEEPTDIPCPRCGRKLVKKFGRMGPFLGCPGWPECKYTRPVDEADLPVPVEGTCPKCGSGLVMRKGRFGRFIHCERRPDCDFTKPFTLGIRCPECGKGEIAEKRSKRGKIFYGCERYPECTFTAWDRPRPTPCPNGCGSTYLLEKETKKGLTLRCPRCKGVFLPETIGA